MQNANQTWLDLEDAPVTGDMTVAAVLAAVPEAERIFEEHAFSPVTHCGPTVQILRLDETPAHCKLHDLEGLLAKLNAAALKEPVT